MHHPIFSQFDRFQGSVAPGFQTNFLSVMTRNSFIAGLVTSLGLQLPEYDYVDAQYPIFDEEYFEWVDFLEAVSTAEKQFTMIELGAGYGRWLVNAAMAARRYNPDMPIKLIGVEAEPTHFEWMKQHFEDNGIDPTQHELIEAAVDEKEGSVSFYVGDPDGWYGQSIAHEGNRMATATVVEVKAITLSSILSNLDLVDLIDLDVQGAELIVLRSAIDDLNQKVKRIHIGTHARDIEQGLRDLFWQHGWYKANDYACNSIELTQWGEIKFGDGVQSWINPRLSPVEPTQTELERLQWLLRSTDVKQFRLQTEVNQLQTELQSSQTALETGQTELQTLRATLEKNQAELQAAQADRDRLQAQSATTHSSAIEQAQVELQQLRQKIQTARTNLKQAQDELQDARADLGKAEGRIAAMESSKFWQLRHGWFRVKRGLGLGGEE
jgi:FkbM family methyltransferase